MYFLTNRHCADADVPGRAEEHVEEDAEEARVQSVDGVYAGQDGVGDA